jgi:hypothetical protein
MGPTLFNEDGVSRLKAFLAMWAFAVLTIARPWMVAASSMERLNNRWTARFRPVTEGLTKLPVANAYLDGKIAVLDSDSVSSFPGTAGCALQQEVP